MKSLALFFTFIVGGLLSCEILSCTAIFVGKEATTDGSVIVTNSDDAFEDNRFFYIKPQPFKLGEKKTIYYQKQANGFIPELGGVPYRNYVINTPSSVYNTGENPSIPLGCIPQVEKTYGYFVNTYPIMNEHQVSIGESTCDAKVIPMPEKGKRIFYSSQLAAAALERCKTAKEAVLLMGKLIEEYGYYGTGEALIVADKSEGWLMEMCGYDKDGSGGLWVAQKIPDNSICAVANQFRIQEVKENDPDFLYCKDLFKICQKKGWWNPEEGSFRWVKAVSNGEFHHPYYSQRRIWRIYSLLKPSANFSPWTDGPFTTQYPVSIIPDKKVSVQDIIKIHRDYYQGTEFDLTKNKAAGPYRNPLLNECPAKNITTANLADVKKDVNGCWERSIAINRCSYYHVNQMRNFLPDEVGGVIWWGFDRPAETCVMSIYAGVTAVPKSFTIGSYVTYNPKSAWWIFNIVANYCQLRYSYMIKDINALQKKIEDNEFAMQPAVENTAISLINSGNIDLARQYLTQYCTSNANSVLKQWKKLMQKLIVKYNYEYIVSEDGNTELIGYPESFLKDSGYYGNLQNYR